jgi:hypothetical protein
MPPLLYGWARDEAAHFPDRGGELEWGAGVVSDDSALGNGNSNLFASSRHRWMGYFPRTETAKHMRPRPALLTILFLLAITLKATAQPSAGGIVYGPKGAFNISAPKGWKLDPTAGAGQGLPCVLYPEGATWETAEPLMYAKIASTDYEDVEAFARDAIDDMKKTRPGFKMKRIASGKTAGGLPYFINEYLPTATYKRFERVAYVQLPTAVAYIVFSADKKSAFEKQRGALDEAVKSVSAMNVDYPDKPKQPE